MRVNQTVRRGQRTYLQRRGRYADIAEGREAIRGYAIWN